MGIGVVKSGLIKNILSISAAMLLAISSTAGLGAPQAKAQSNASGFGVIKCAGFLTALQSSDEADSTVLLIGVFSWIEGFYTGRNAERAPSQQKDLDSVEFEQTLITVGAACGEFPGAHIFEIADALYQNLPDLPAAAGV